MVERIKLEWDGEKIKQSTIVEDEKYGPKDLLNAIDQAKNQLGKFKEEKIQILKNTKALEQNIINIQSFIFDRSKFEEKAEEINKNKLLDYIEKFSPQLIIDTQKEVSEELSKDENALTDNQKKNFYYVTFQKKLSRHKKIADNIAHRIIRQDLFVKPVFENPFKN